MIQGLDMSIFSSLHENKEGKVPYEAPILEMAAGSSPGMMSRVWTGGQRVG